MASFTCKVCDEPVSELGSYVKLSSTTRAHLNCFVETLKVEVIEDYRMKQEEDRKLRERATEDAIKGAQEAARKELAVLVARDPTLWTREDRRRLVEAKMICVHCGKKLGSGEGRGAEGKHCGPCYIAREYGEKQAAEAAAKSAASVDAAAAVLAGAKPAEQKPEEKKQEGQKQDRFALIEME